MRTLLRNIAFNSFFSGFSRSYNPALLPSRCLFSGRSASSFPSSPTELDNATVQRVKDSFSRQGFMGHLNAELTVIKPGLVQIEVPYSTNLTQQHGYFHAGVTGTLADNCGGYSSFTLMDEGDSVLTVEYKLNLLSPAEGDKLIAQGNVIKAGRTIFTTRSDVYAQKRDGGMKLCATSLQTVMRIRNRPDKPATN